MIHRGNDPDAPDLSPVLDWYVAEAAKHATEEYGVALSDLGLDEDAIADVLYEENISQIHCRTSDAVQPDDIVDDRAQRYGLLGLADLAY